jgi:hypothetical protein
LGYLPEVPWNDTCASSLALGLLENFFSSVYAVTDAESGCNAIVVYANQLNNQTYGGYLDLVDTVGGGGGASGCVVANPIYNAITGGTTGCTAGATSTGTSTNPDTGTTQASINLHNNGWIKPNWQTGVTGIPSDGVRDIPDISFFASDGSLSSSAYLICVSDVAACSYSLKTEPIRQEVGGTSVATPAMAGVMALINQKTGASQGNPNAELYKLASSQTYSSCLAERGNSAPVTSSSCLFNDIDKGTIAMACDYSAHVNTPSPNCSTIHSGDSVGILPGYSAGAGYDLATGLGSLNVANIVNAWPKTVGSAAATVTVQPAVTSLNSNNTLSVTVTVAGAVVTQTGVNVPPTGTVTLSASSPSTYSAPGTLSSSGSVTFTIPANSLGAPSSTLTAKYAGDSVYAPASNTAAVTVTTIVLLTPSVTVTPASKTLNSNASLGVTAAVSGASITPTGTVTLTSGSYSSGAQTLASGSYSFTIPANTLGAGADVLNVSYSGDANYAASPTNSAPVTVTESTFSLTQTPIVVSPATGIAPGASATATATVSSTGGYTGTVTLTCQLQSTTASGGDGATCTGGGSPGISLTGGTSSGTVVFTVGTTAPVAELAYPKLPGKGWMGAGGGAILALLVFFGIPARRRSWQQMLGVLVLMAALGCLSACGGGSSSGSGGGGGGGGGGTGDPGTTKGAYTFLVQGTGTPSVTPAVSTTFTVTVN